MKKKTKKKLLIVIVMIAAVVGISSVWSTFSKNDNPTINFPIEDVTYTFDVNELDNKIVLITNQTESYTNTASGVVIGHDLNLTYMITNAHVFDSVGSIIVQNKTLSFTASLLPGSINTALDLAIVTIPRNDSFQKVAMKESYLIGDLVVAIGYPRANFQVSPGQISTFNPGRITSSAPIQPGSSGSGLFDMELNLIGINKQMVTDINGNWLSTVSIPSTVINTYIIDMGLTLL